MSKTDNWRGCYDGGWTDLITPEAFAHPAKFSRALVARIYDHCRAEGWLHGSYLLTLDSPLIEYLQCRDAYRAALTAASQLDTSAVSNALAEVGRRTKSPIVQSEPARPAVGSSGRKPATPRSTVAPPASTIGMDAARQSSSAQSAESHSEDTPRLAENTAHPSAIKPHSRGTSASGASIRQPDALSKETQEPAAPRIGSGGAESTSSTTAHDGRKSQDASSGKPDAANSAAQPKDSKSITESLGDTVEVTPRAISLCFALPITETLIWLLTAGYPEHFQNGKAKWLRQQHECTIRVSHPLRAGDTLEILSDTILDPFGGVALGALDAMRLGLTWVGCELEPKFVALGGQNIALWQRRFGHVPGWGSARLIQGDSRRLAEVVAGAGLAVSSPPYAASLKGNVETIDADRLSRLKDAGYEERSQHGFLRSVHSKSLAGDYSENPSNLGNLPATSRGLSLALSSPPYVEAPGHDTGHPRLDATEDARRETDGCARRNGYGKTEGQLSQMRAGQPPSAVVSSPPWQDAGTQCPSFGTSQVVGNSDRAWVQNWEKGAREKTKTSYGTSPGNLGNLPPGDPAAVISSPPYEGLGVNIKGHGIIGARVSKDKHYGSAEYGESAGQLGVETGADFWSASRVILEQVYAVLKPGGHAVFVTKAFCRKGKLVDFPAQWTALCEAVGFRHVCEHHALLATGSGEQRDIFGNHKKLEKRRVSFFRRLYESRPGAPRIDFERVDCFEKP